MCGDGVEETDGADSGAAAEAGEGLEAMDVEQAGSGSTNPVVDLVDAPTPPVTGGGSAGGGEAVEEDEEEDVACGESSSKKARLA